MSAATSFYATFQQLMLSLGICVGAVSLHLGMLADRPRRARARRLLRRLLGGHRHLGLGDAGQPPARPRRRRRPQRP